MAVKRNCISVPINVFGGNIREAVSQGIALARKIDCPVHMEFNKTHVPMYPDSDVEAVARAYGRNFGHMEEEAPSPSSLRDDLRSALEGMLRVHDDERATDDEIDEAVTAGRRAIVAATLADMKSE